MIKSIMDIIPFKAGDDTLIREVWHPKNDNMDLPFSVAFATLNPGESSLPHILENSVEAYMIINGKGLVTVGETKQEVTIGHTVMIPAGTTQYIENIGNDVLAFYCIVAPAWQKSNEVIL